MGKAKEENSGAPDASLTPRDLHLLSQTLQVIRTTVSHVHLPGASPLAVLDSTAVDALKNLYYTVNTEDPLNAMPARRLVLEQRLVSLALLPLISAVHGDPASATNQKRWSVPMYQTLRLLSVLSIPISLENPVVKIGSNLDSHLIQLRADLANNRSAVHALVSLLQYYIERKAEKQAALASAEESKLEDARIDNILRFFRNILCPPRAGVGDEIIARDRGVHLALVAALVDADFFSTLAILFSSREDAHSQYTDLVFLVADIYAQAYRHTTPKELYFCYRRSLKRRHVEESLPPKGPATAPAKQCDPASIFDEPSGAPPALSSSSHRIRKSSKNLKKPSGIRAALQRERTFIGGSRAITTSARWTSRHSGGFIASSQRAPTLSTTSAGGEASADVQTHQGLLTSDSMGKGKNISRKRIMSARNAIQSKLSLNPMRSLQESIKTNSDLLCMITAKQRRKSGKHNHLKNKLTGTMRKDLEEEGVQGVVTMTAELIESCFDNFIRELRERIEETKARSLGDEARTLLGAQRSFLSIVGSVVGFQREKHGKIVISTTEEHRRSSTQIHLNSMKDVLASDLKILKREWEAVAAGIGVETFRFVFRILVESSDSVKNGNKNQKQIRDVELSTFAVLEMMKMLQGMAAYKDEGEIPIASDVSRVHEHSGAKLPDLTSRETALNTLEQLFEQHEFLNAPADLAKDYNAKLFSFQHLTNIVEVTHAFATILLDEKEFAHLRVSKSLRSKKAEKTRKLAKTQKQRPPGTKETAFDDCMVEGLINSGSKGKADAGREYAAGAVAENLACGPKVANLDVTTGLKTPQGGKVSPADATETKPSISEARLETQHTSASSPNIHSANIPKDATLQVDQDLSGPDVHTDRGEENATDQGGRNGSGASKDFERTAFSTTQRTAQGMKEQLSIPIGHPLENIGQDVTVKPIEGEGDSADDEEDGKMREVESLGIIRRFAHAKAIQALLLPVRAAVCSASSLSGSIHDIPEGSGPLLSHVVVAKSTHLLAAVWRVAKVKEKGAMCGQFYTYGTMHLLSTTLEAAKNGSVLENSVLERFSVFAQDVTKSFFSWLSLNAGLALDMFFIMDKGTCLMYANSVGQGAALLEKRNTCSDSGNDSDASALASGSRRRYDMDDPREYTVERNTNTQKRNRALRQKMAEIRLAERGNIEEDEDVDDFDNLDIGGGPNTSDEDVPACEAEALKSAAAKGPGKRKRATVDLDRKGSVPVSFCRVKRSKKKRLRAFDPFESDDEILKSRMARKSATREKRGGRKTKLQPKELIPGKVFYSSDEYGELHMDTPESSGLDDAKGIDSMEKSSAGALIGKASELTAAPDGHPRGPMRCPEGATRSRGSTPADGLSCSEAGDEDLTCMLRSGPAYSNEESEDDCGHLQALNKPTKEQTRADEKVTESQAIEPTSTKTRKSPQRESTAPVHTSPLSSLHADQEDRDGSYERPYELPSSSAKNNRSGAARKRKMLVLDDEDSG